MSPWRKQLNGAVFSFYKNTTTAFLTWCPFWKLSVGPKPQTPVYYSVNDALPGKNIKCTKSIFERWNQWHSVSNYCLMFSFHRYQGMLTMMFSTDNNVRSIFTSFLKCFLKCYVFFPRSTICWSQEVATLRQWVSLPSAPSYPTHALYAPGTPDDVNGNG